jgi:hypothetical protein
MRKCGFEDMLSAARSQLDAPGLDNGGRSIGNFDQLDQN